MVGLSAICEGSHGHVDSVTADDGEHCSQVRPDAVEEGPSYGVKQRPGHRIAPSPEQAGPPSSFLRFSSFRGSHRSTGGWCPIRVAVMLPLRADEAAVYQHSYPNDTLRSQPVRIPGTKGHPIMRPYSKPRRVLLILSLAVAILSIGLPTVLFGETTGTTTLATEFMTLSGLDLQIQQMPKQYMTLVDMFFNGIEQGGHRIPGKMKRMVRQNFQDALKAERLQEEIRHRLDQDLPEQVAKPALDWLHTDLGKKITALETETDSPESVLQQAAFAIQLQNEPPSPARMGLTRRLEAASGASDHAVEGWETVTVALGIVMAANTGLGLPDSKEAVRERLAKMRPTMKNLLLQASLRHILYTYRTLTDDELGRYVEFLESDAGRQVTRIVDGVVMSVSSSAIEQMETTLTDSLASRRRKSGV